ncbi:overexpressed in colon carcinoma 1 protein isoform X1 [Bufo bufo]|uniref:overexpressed in colon carcinoma 1 protein isoform X1 n=1 Tax=Bufo bufo TaxID=8384 RepID=UPI001ABE2F4B|nr:overexpressed in colon carcinoma 1 protein isoform X1 [Bufo bufo]
MYGAYNTRWRGNHHCTHWALFCTNVPSKVAKIPEKTCQIRHLKMRSIDASTSYMDSKEEEDISILTEFNVYLIITEYQAPSKPTALNATPESPLRRISASTMLD